MITLKNSLAILFSSLLFYLPNACADADFLAHDVAQLQADKVQLAADRDLLMRASQQLQQDRAKMVNDERRYETDKNAARGPKHSFWHKPAPAGNANPASTAPSSAVKPAAPTPSANSAPKAMPPAPEPAMTAPTQQPAAAPVVPPTAAPVATTPR